MTVKFRRAEAKDLQHNIEQTVKQLNEEPFVGGSLVTVTTTSTAQFDIITGVNKTVRGWVVVDTDVAVNFYRVNTPQDSQGVLTLVPSTDGTYTFWVF